MAGIIKDKRVSFETQIDQVRRLIRRNGGILTALTSTMPRGDCKVFVDDLPPLEKADPEKLKEYRAQILEVKPAIGVKPDESGKLLKWVEIFHRADYIGQAEQKKNGSGKKN